MWVLGYRADPFRFRGLKLGLPKLAPVETHSANLFHKEFRVGSDPVRGLVCSHVFEPERAGYTAAMMKSTALTIAAAGLVALAAACGNDDDSQDAQDGTGAVMTGTGAVMTTAESAIDETKLAAFVAAFRTGYAELAQDRSDEDIEMIATQSCAHLAAGADKETVTVEIETLAANDGTKPSQEQAENIYNLVTPACP
ncbi:hypothetical protein C8K38_10953 [Rhodococcus sp. OK611]|jgi:hypothetical protein|uniref:hypothetical protein n=1 Tax=unclassified Rhodococcus (in: high G+C Gram-positive bacteria) TaxID=192944 RepID=UPI000BCAAF16|nr:MULTISPECIES: hypothetical protein [unclassified Rhodococcus (in: high G+C Gram-positive bacteria)]PTR42976.1 hypothetical protein C8K38_10953 [Rhodococcus sp. OK611]SNX91311.1 hypothetical protein SAMN05447004_10953 [Rhodococcus sp. OK270]